MNIIGAQLIQDELGRQGYFFKVIFNNSGAAFFSGKTEHCTVKAAGLSYEDDYKGNALAAILTAGRFEIRRHADFTYAQVSSIISSLFDEPELELLRGFKVTYQGKTIREGGVISESG